MTTEMAKTYDPGAVEGRIYRWWEENGYFKPRENAARQPFVVSMPPPNVTGELHLGHALFSTLEDVMVRYHRMKGDPTLWVPGSDHAGIATQMVVERMLRKEGVDRHTLGREAFVERVWEWKERYGHRITAQLRRLGASCDWSRERFTLDAGLSKAVREVFVRLHEEGLLYRDDRIINWCPRCESAISDLEVDHEDRQGKLYHLRYRFADDPTRFIEAATTRPETLLGDTAIAVHPDDERYQHLIGKEVRVPGVGRRIPIVADEAVERAFGAGAVKVTPAHDPTDFAIGARHDLPRITVIGFDARMTAEAGPYAGLDRYEAREKLLADLEESGDLSGAEDYTIPIATCDRCGTVIESLISLQWWVSMTPLATPAIAAVTYGQTRIVPERFTKVYLDWLNNIQPWCISRQLWWGHRIPAWYCPDGHTTVTHEDPTACTTCGKEDLTQDADVLDTWFSSWLWPFSTLGWPETTPDLARYYPTAVLETGYDILFPWVARMMMAGLHFVGAVPFHTIYLHGLVRDEKGEKMSKSKGNVIDPLDAIDEFGTDALRYTLVTSSTPGQDSKLAKARIEGARNFATKIWNAARFVLSQAPQGGAPGEAGPSSLADRWISSRLDRLTADSTHLLDELSMGEAGRQTYEFFWSEYCDWYLEIAKIQLRRAEDAGDAPAKEATLSTLIAMLDGALRLLHPFMPFITEEIYAQIPGHGEALIVAPWPTAGGRDLEAEKEMDLIISLIGGVRTARSELSIEPRRKLSALVAAPTEEHRVLLEAQRPVIEALAGLDALDIQPVVETPPDQSLHLPFPTFEVYLPLEGVVDMAAERTRAEAEIARVQGAITSLQGRLDSPAFTGKAPAAVVEKERVRLNENQDLLERLKSRVAVLSGAPA